MPRGITSESEELLRETYDIVTDNDSTRRQRYDAHVTTSTDGTATQHYTRYYPALPDKWNSDMLLRAIHRLFVEVVAKPRQLEMGIQAPAAGVMYQFCYRTEMSRGSDGEVLGGDPGPEGVHVDGGTAAMILVARRENIKPQTGGTRIWSNEQPTGKPMEEDVDSDKLLHTWQPAQEFDALFFLDERVLHEALQGDLLDSASVGNRDMLILDVRREDRSWFSSRPVQKGSKESL